MKKEKVLLIDGNSILNRAFYAIPVLTNKNGIYTNAVFGFLNIFFRFMDEDKPDYVAVAFDLPSPTFRHNMYDEYKGTRKPMPEELRPQILLIKEVLKKMNIEYVEKAGYEADDILGTLADFFEKENFEVSLVSGDKDMLQLATENIKIKIPKTKAGKTEVEIYNASDVLEKIGVTPSEFIDVKALMGDASDNIPGVPSIGEKTAIKIISEYKNIETAILNYESVKPKKASENLSEFKEQAILSKKLATIIKDVPIELSPDQFKLKDIHNSEVTKAFEELEFKSLLTRFGKIEKKISNEFIEISDFEEIKKQLEIANEQEFVAYNLLNIDGVVHGISIFHEKTNGFFVPLNNFNEESIINIFREFFESTIKKISINSKFEKVYLDRYNITVNKLYFDCSLGGYILNSSGSSYSYDNIAVDFLGERYSSEEEIFGKGKSKKSITEIEKSEILNFACLQSKVAYQSYFIMYEKLKENNQLELYFEIELPLVDVLKDMELFGIKVDKKALLEYQKMLGEKIELLTSEIYETAGEEFNINSPQQLGVILFEKLGLKGSKKTKTGYSTNHEVLEKLRSQHPLINLVLDYRTLTKLKSTYADGLLNVLADDDKVYSTFNQVITTTGRISSTEPNLQNIPIKMSIGRELRKIFIPSSEDYVFLDGDYSQIELRVLAHISGDETLINAFLNNEDIHRLTASQVFKVPMELVTPTQRGNAKAVNFGIVYGISAFSLSQDLKITKKEADNYINGYFEKYPKVKEYLEETVKNAHAKGYAETLFNRRREIPELKSSNFNLRSFGERVAMNMPIQGTAADIIKIAMNRVYSRIKEENLDAKLILQVHDELLIEVNKKDKERAMEIFEYEMENAFVLKSKLEADFSAGDNWYEAK